MKNLFGATFEGTIMGALPGAIKNVAALMHSMAYQTMIRRQRRHTVRPLDARTAQGRDDD
jgi:hypothetical protein